MFLSEDKLKDTDFTPTLRGKQLLLEPECRAAWQAFRSVIPLTDGDFHQYYTATVESFAEYVQTIPATRYSLYAQPYGMLQLGLDRAILCTKQALKVYQDNDSVTPDQLSSLQHAEVFAVFSAAMLNDLGTLPLRFRIHVKNRLDQAVAYDPYASSMHALGKAFSWEFCLPELADWQAPASLILAKNVLTHTGQNYKNSAFAWLSRHHDVLQLWYNLMLNITPRDEEATRRTLLTLIPRSDAIIFEKFVSDSQVTLDNNFLNARRGGGLFQEPTKSPEALRDETNRLMDLGVIAAHERVADGFAVTDASNSRTLGSYGAANAPRLMLGFAFLRWMQQALKNGQLLLNDEQASSIFRTDQGLVLNWPKVAEAFAKHQTQQKQTPLTAEKLLVELQKLSITTAKELHLRDFALKTGQGKTNFQGIVLSNPYLLYGNKALPPLTLGLREVSVTRPAAVQTAQARAEFKPTLE